MDTKVYESKRQVTLKDGTVREYTTHRRYTPKQKEVQRTEIYKRVHSCDTETLLEIKKILDSKIIKNEHENREIS